MQIHPGLPVSWRPKRTSVPPPVGNRMNPQTRVVEHVHWSPLFSCSGPQALRVMQRAFNPQSTGQIRGGSPIIFPINFNGGHVVRVRIQRCERCGTGAIPVGLPNFLFHCIARKAKQSSQRSAKPGYPVQVWVARPFFQISITIGPEEESNPRVWGTRTERRRWREIACRRQPEGRECRGHSRQTAGALPAGPTNFIPS